MRHTRRWRWVFPLGDTLKNQPGWHGHRSRRYFGIRRLTLAIRVRFGCRFWRRNPFTRCLNAVSRCGESLSFRSCQSRSSAGTARGLRLILKPIIWRRIGDRCAPDILADCRRSAATIGLRSFTRPAFRRGRNSRPCGSQCWIKRHGCAIQRAATWPTDDCPISRNRFANNLGFIGCDGASLRRRDRQTINCGRRISHEV